MPEPVFTDTMQIGIVVRDLEATVRRYEDDYGIGPWELDRIDLGDASDYREYGQPSRRSNRVAFAMVGQVMWELIEPLDEDGLILSGEVNGARVAFLPTERDLGVILEGFSGMPER